MKDIIESLKTLKDPHSKKIQQNRERYQELDELLCVAAGLGDENAYNSIQTEMREVFLDYLTALSIDTMYRLTPHAIFIWLLSLKFGTVEIPWTDWQINILLFYLIAYGVFRGSKSLFKAYKRNLFRTSTSLN